MTAEAFAIIVSSVLGVFLVMGIGALCRVQHWLTHQADVSLAKLTAKVLLPCLFLDRILGDPTLSSLGDAWLPPTLGFSITTFGFVAAWYVAKTIGPFVGLKTDPQQRAFALCAGICNYGYIPLPLAQITYPNAEVEMILHNVGVDLSLWSVGVAIVTGSGKVKPNQPLSLWRKNWERIRPVATSAPLIAVVVALTIRSLGIETYIPKSAMRSVGLLAASSIPLGLLLSGAILVDFLRAADWSGSAPVIGLAVGFRQLFMPIVMLGIAGITISSTDLKQVLLLEAAMPSAVFPIVLTRLYEGDTATALRVVLSTSLLGIVLIPVWMAIGAWWLAV
ncbi:AEC family transporter [Rhodopirellula halodulae]|uniref:AEC family transporter n=1 Tax=Rhodopirellula halodulae TaxID=2894198 RepID=UPI001E6242F8|nr:AEC family transporter [Rhodopirellula sp. JC737]MCC9658587.1 AEC family transporter [Rhodopirellula sp. JC737]